MESSTLAGVTREPETFEGHQFIITRGDYSPLLKLVVEELKKAKVSQVKLLLLNISLLFDSCIFF